MLRNTVSPSLRSKKSSGPNLDPETALLGGLTPALSQTRVLAANYESSLVRPADLEAFLRGHVNVF
ncbi:MAG: hypothetical protein AB1641_10505 [Thermodesulfobacteriota bacterium]